MRILASLGVAAVVLLAGTTAPAQNVDYTTALKGLSNPCGVAVQADSGTIFVSDSGTGRILRLKSDKTVDVAIDKFPKDVYGKGPMYDIGPLGLVFIGKNDLVVGGGGNPDGKELVRLYDISADKTFPASKMKGEAGPLGPGEATEKGEGNFYGVAYNGKTVFITANGDDTKGWVLKVEVSDGKLGELEPAIATKEATGVDAPVGIAFDPDGNLAVGQMGEITVPQDSLLSIYDPKSGKLLANGETGLFDICALAFSPSGKLYALDFAWMDTTQGGLFRLDYVKDGDSLDVTPVKLLGLDKPAAMTFGPDGALYVTEFGTAKEGDKIAPGRLIKVTGEL